MPIPALAYLNVRRSALLVSVAPPAAAEAEVREHVAKRVRAATALGAFKAFLSELIVRIPSNWIHRVIRSPKGVGKGGGYRCIDGQLILCKSKYIIPGTNIDKRDGSEVAMLGHVRPSKKYLSTRSVEMWFTPVIG